MPDNKQLKALHETAAHFEGVLPKASALITEAADTIERLEAELATVTGSYERMKWARTEAVRERDTAKAERERGAAVLEALTSDEPITRLSEEEANSAASFAGVVSNELYGRGPHYMRAKVHSAIQTALQRAQEQVGGGDA